MELLSINVARSIWLLPVNDLNPRGKSLFPILAPLVQKYNFLKFPQGPELTGSPTSFKFDDGLYTTVQGVPLRVGLTVYADGFVADTRSSTADTDAFLHDVLTWLSDTFGLRPYHEILRRRGYLSEAYVRFPASLNEVNPAFGDFRTMLAGHSILGSDVPYHVTGITFGQDPARGGGAPSFRLERAETAHFEEGRYFSTAQLQTEIHLHLLDILESIILGNPYQA